mmetsp:Transcript_30838/g.73449  ORF Transcript_30838/g.73449 Transcript_30838/m.73449 type:complete len:254 (+) Transcript_30838:1439-2200(+)
MPEEHQADVHCRVRGLRLLESCVACRDGAVQLVAACEDVSLRDGGKVLRWVLHPDNINIAEHQVEPEPGEGLRQPNLLPAHHVEVPATPYKRSCVEPCDSAGALLVHGEGLDPCLGKPRPDLPVHCPNEVVGDAVLLDVMHPVEDKVGEVVVGPGDDDDVVPRDAPRKALRELWGGGNCRLRRSQGCADRRPSGGPAGHAHARALGRGGGSRGSSIGLAAFGVVFGIKAREAQPWEGVLLQNQTLLSHARQKI